MNSTINPEDEIIKRFALCADRLLDTLRGLDKSHLDLAAIGGGWTIRQYVHHIVDGDDIWKFFIKQAVGNQQSTFLLDWYWQIPQEDWARAWAYADREIQPSIALFCANREHVVQLLHQIPGIFEKCLKICWPDGSEEQVSVKDVIEMQTRHVDGHIADIQGILAVHQGKPTVEKPS